jgi:protein-S-isoprenylcysteine O-methyltransferase Ste14
VSEPRKFWMRWRVRVGYPVAVIYWFLARPTVSSIAIGGIVAALGLLVRGVSAGYLRKDSELATGGPYAATRNPLYLGSSLLAAGFIVAGRSWWAGLLVGIYFAVFYYAVMRNEEADLRKRFGVLFEEYAAHVPLFFPRAPKPAKRERSSTVSFEQPPSGAPQPAAEFSGALYLRNREYRALIGTAAGLAVVGLRMWLRLRFGY